MERIKQRVLDNAKETDQWVEEILFLFEEATEKIETEIEAMFQRYTTENGLTQAEASKMLTSSEYSQWRKGIEEYVKEAEGDSKVLLELNTLAMKSQISRKEKLLASIYQTMITLSKETEMKMTTFFKDRVQTSYYRSCYDVQSILKIGFPVAKVDTKMLQSILEHPWSGKNYSKALWDNTDKLASLAKREITLGFMSGSSVPKMTKAINDVMGKGRYAAERLVRTESSYFSNQGELASYKEMDIAEYIFLGGGCDSCKSLNGLAFSVEEAEVGVNYPPMHPNCKCTTRAKVSRKVFQNRNGANPLQDNPKFEEWKKKYVDKHPVEPIIELSEDEEYAIRKYVSGDAYKWNGKLRKNKALTERETVLVQNLDSALQKMPKYEGVVYRSLSKRGIKDIKEFISIHKPRMKIQFPEFLSSATKVYDASFPIQYVITSKTGRDIRKFNEKENEILFERKTVFLVIKVEENVIYMEEV